MLAGTVVRLYAVFLPVARADLLRDQLLVLATVSVPLVKSFYFLEAEVGGVLFKLGTWGFCANDVCSNSTLGYSLGECACGASRTGGGS